MPGLGTGLTCFIKLVGTLPGGGATFEVVGVPDFAGGVAALVVVVGVALGVTVGVVAGAVRAGAAAPRAAVLAW